MAAHLLVVDDQADLTSLFKNFFGALGYRVSVANDGITALALDESDPADLLITDLTMPQMSGQELIAQLRARRPALPVIVMSGYGDEGDLAAPHTVVLTKPVSLVTVKQRIEALLAKPA